MSFRAENAPGHNGFRASDVAEDAAVAPLHPHAALVKVRGEMFAAWRRWIAEGGASAADVRLEMDGTWNVMRQWAALEFEAIARGATEPKPDERPLTLARVEGSGHGG